MSKKKSKKRLHEEMEKGVSEKDVSFFSVFRFSINQFLSKVADFNFRFFLFNIT